MTEKYNKDFLIREIAARADFTIEDVKIIFQTLEEIIKEIVEEKAILLVGGLFKINVTEIKEHEGYDPYHDKIQKLPTSYRVNIKASKSLTQLVKK